MSFTPKLYFRFYFAPNQGQNCGEVIFGENYQFTITHNFNTNVLKRNRGLPSFEQLGPEVCSRFSRDAVTVIWAPRVLGIPIPKTLIASTLPKLFQTGESPLVGIVNHEFTAEKCRCV